jgi:hypothetical protein
MSEGVTARDRHELDVLCLDLLSAGLVRDASELHAHSSNELYFTDGLE